jgi:hypothetical protein
MIAVSNKDIARKLAAIENRTPRSPEESTAERLAALLTLDCSPILPYAHRHTVWL